MRAFVPAEAGDRVGQTGCLCEGPHVHRPEGKRETKVTRYLSISAWQNAMRRMGINVSESPKDDPRRGWPRVRYWTLGAAWALAVPAGSSHCRPEGVVTGRCGRGGRGPLWAGSGRWDALQSTARAQPCRVCSVTATPGHSLEMVFLSMRFLVALV